MPKTWKPSKNCPKNHKDLRAFLTALAKKRTGNKLIATKYSKDHLFLGHTKGDIKKIAADLAKLRGKPLSTLMVSPLASSAQAEVLNWIKNVPDSKLKFDRGTWTIDTNGSTVKAASSYKYITVDIDAFRSMDKDDIVKKSRKWCTISTKTPKVACQFDADGTPMIYHLDY